ncbi:hypothetical protein GCM10027445_44200 [Amycolatopsis endophytica]|uniref:DUF1453 domain-containing protein n=1 Tax=Amycolatopsis endophytica TaxID=860233 RepID=A0A853BDB1_9PSEU|nr:DUF1453 domain-containing protein [Amycolatopsis endophytica]NYI93219.1 hypothetical protein [Amycolatopsis endophytica]
MSGPVQIVLIVLIIGYILTRRLSGVPAQGKRILLLPAVLVVLGVTKLHQVDALELITSGALSVVLGGARGASIRLYSSGGVVFLRYTALTVVLWLVNIGAKLGLGVLFGSVADSLLLTLGLGVLVEGVVVLGRALRTGDRIVWAKGRGGAPHRTSPLLDDLQRRFRTGR